MPHIIQPLGFFVFPISEGTAVAALYLFFIHTENIIAHIGGQIPQGDQILQLLHPGAEFSIEIFHFFKMFC